MKLGKKRMFTDISNDFISPLHFFKPSPADAKLQIQESKASAPFYENCTFASFGEASLFALPLIQQN